MPPYHALPGTPCGILCTSWLPVIAVPDILVRREEALGSYLGIIRKERGMEHIEASFLLRNETVLMRKVLRFSLQKEQKDWIAEG